VGDKVEDKVGDKVGRPTRKVGVIACSIFIKRTEMPLQKILKLSFSIS
jgi:hypothetical protein